MLVVAVVAEVELAQLDGIETRNLVWGWYPGWSVEISLACSGIGPQSVYIGMKTERLSSFYMVRWTHPS